jgi:hypothetical protein
MKKAILLIMVLFSYAISFSQSFNYQAVVRDASNNPIANQAIGVQLKILDGSATGVTLYTETHAVTSNANGVIAINVGEGTTMDVFSAINWSTQSHWLDLSVDITGGTMYSNLGTTKLLQVPYALHATVADNITTPYTAGSGIEVTNNVISSTNEGWLRTNGALPTTVNQEIYRTGNIGIGATASNPEFPLDVRGTFGTRMRTYTEDAYYAGLVSKNSTREFFAGVQGAFETNDSSSGFHIYDNTAGAQRMVIDEDGNVGINQANPNQKLQVNGSIRMVDGNQQNGYVMVSDGSGTGSWQSQDVLDNQTADVFQLNVNALELSLENDGAVTQTVDLSGYLDNTDNQTADVFQLNVNALELSLENDDAATQTVDLSGYLDNTDVQKADVFQLTNNTLELSLENDGEDTKTIDLGAYLDADNLGDHTATQALNLNSNTILGVTNVTTGTLFSTAANATINTTTPNGAEGIIMAGSTSDYLVSVQDGNGRVQHKWNATYGTSETFVKGNEDAAFIDINGDAADNNTAWIEFKHADGAFAVAGDAISWNTHLMINQGGEVGINETSPDDMLHVTAAGNGTRVRLENSGNGWAGMVAKNTQRELFIGIQGAFDANPGEFHIFDNTAGARRMVIDATGEVGIGRNNPSVKLDVNGSVNCTGGTCSSDERWKRNITTLDNTLANISKLRGVSYFWRTQEFPDRDFESDKQIGVIAQEVEKIYPELIHTDNEGFKSMDYMSLSAVLLEATKQQQVLIEQQQSELELLKKKLDKLDALEAKVNRLLSE